MSKNARIEPEHPVDVVILWVDGNDPVLTEKRNQYLKKEDITSSHSGALPTRFASKNEISYCVLSILTFAPFVRNVFIVTDGQNPNLYDDIKTYFPNKTSSIKIVDHKEIFRGYEQYLPTFNSSSILSLIWRIQGLSENFVCFSDDVFLIREVKPEDWFINNIPVMRGTWRLPPFRKILGNYIKLFINKRIRKNPDYQPRLSFYLRQWRAAYLLGMRLRYFFHCHTPHPQSRRRMEEYFSDKKEMLEENISYRFRNQEQYIMTSLAYHLEILNGNTQFAKLNLGYIHPHYSKKRLNRKISRYENNDNIKSVCIQSLDMIDQEEENRIFNWMDMILKHRRDDK